MTMQSFIVPFLLTLGAGLATGVGSAIAFAAKHTNRRLLSFSLGLSGGVMVYVSFVELMPQGAELLAEHFAGKVSEWINLLAFFGGMAFIGLIDHLVPSVENPHEAHSVEELQHKPRQSKLMRVGLMSALAIAIHNFPEGIATFTAGMNDPALGLAIAVAVAIHNIPEGIAVSVPIFFATESRKRAFLWSLLSGLAEPLGALAAWLILAPILTPALLGCILTAVAGIMVYISLDELLPAAREHGEAHTAIAGVVVGMIIMAVSLLIV